MSTGFGTDDNTLKIANSPFSHRLQEVMLLMVIWCITIWLTLITWTTLLTPTVKGNAVLPLLLVHLLIMLIVLPVAAIKGNQGTTSQRLWARFRSRTVYVFLLTEFACTQFIILFTGFSYKNPSASVLLAYLVGLLLVLWIVCRQDKVNIADAAFAIAWSVLVLYTRGATGVFMFVYARGSGPISLIGLIMAIFSVITLVLLLPLPLLLQNSRFRQRLLRVKARYSAHPARLYRVLPLACVYLLIGGMLPYPLNNAGLWVAVLVTMPILGLLFTSSAKSQADMSVWTVNERTFRRALWILVIVFLLMAVISAAKQMWTWFPDMYVYLHMAREYARGHFLVRGYWSPLMPWLLAPLIGLGIDPQVAQRFLTIAADAVVILLSVALARRFDLSRLFQLVVAGMVALVFLQHTYFPGTSDILAVVPVMLFFLVLLHPRLWSAPAQAGLLIGVLIALGYYAKQYNLPFMLATLIATLILYVLHGQSIRKATIITAFCTMSMVILLAPWIVAISQRYGMFTYSTTSIIARNTPLSGDISHGCVDYFICTEPRDVIFAWEDPLLRYYPGLVWSPFATLSNFQSQLVSLHASAILTLDKFPLGPLGLLALLALTISIYFYWKNQRVRFLLLWVVMVIAIETGGYIATGQMLKYELLEFRYYLSIVPLGVTVVCWLMQKGFARLASLSGLQVPLFYRKFRTTLLLLILGVSLTMVSFPEIVSNLAAPEQMASWIATGLPRPFPCDRIAAEAINDVLVPPFAATDLVYLAISFYTEKRSVGIVVWPAEKIPSQIRANFETIDMNAPSTPAEVDAELRRTGVKTFVVVDAPDLAEALVSKFHYTSVRNLTICQMASEVLYLPNQLTEVQAISGFH